MLCSQRSAEYVPIRSQSLRVLHKSQLASLSHLWHDRRPVTRLPERVQVVVVVALFRPVFHSVATWGRNARKTDTLVEMRTGGGGAFWPLGAVVLAAVAVTFTVEARSRSPLIDEDLSKSKNKAAGQIFLITYFHPKKKKTISCRKMFLFARLCHTSAKIRRKLKRSLDLFTENCKDPALRN